jgi:Fe-S cluster biosynthesis and repair protein YggX
MGCRVFISIGKEAWTQIHRHVWLQLLLVANNPYNTGEAEWPGKGVSYNK